MQRKNLTVFEQPILETKPDELIYAYRFEEIAVEGDSIVVKEKFGKPTFTLPLSSLA